MAERMNDEEFRAAVLAGSEPGTNDPPERRAAAAAVFLADVADTARRAEVAAAAAVEKAEAQLQAARDAMAQAAGQRDAAEHDAERAAALNLSLNGGGGVQVNAGVAEASGGAS